MSRDACPRFVFCVSGGTSSVASRERFSFEKGETRRRHSATRPKVSGKTALFPRNDRPYGLKRTAFQTENAPGPVNTNFTNNSIDRINRLYTRHLSLVAKLSRIPDSSPIKAPGEGMGGLGGKGKTSRASSDRRRPQAVPVATKEATGIDSRDEGFPFPQTTYE